MTIIAYCHKNKEVYVDSLTSWSNGRGPVSTNKIDRFTHRGERVVYTQSGSTIVGRDVIISLLDAIDRDAHTISVLNSESDGVAVFAAYRGKHWFVLCKHDKTGNVSDIVRLSDMQHDVCNGSGGTFYSAYRATGMTVESAIICTAKYHTGCGLPIRCFDADGISGEIPGHAYTDVHTIA